MPLPLLPPAFHLVALDPELDAFARAVRAAPRGIDDGTVYWADRSDRLDLAIVLEPEAPAARTLEALYVLTPGRGRRHGRTAAASGSSILRLAGGPDPGRSTGRKGQGGPGAGGRCGWPAAMAGAGAADRCRAARRRAGPHPGSHLAARRGCGRCRGHTAGGKRQPPLPALDQPLARGRPGACPRRLERALPTAAASQARWPWSASVSRGLSKASTSAAPLSSAAARPSSSIL